MSHDYFENRSCRYYPCHNAEHINCLFCYCPLYWTDCGGAHVTVNGVKDCSRCLFPHIRGNYQLVVSKLRKELNHEQNHSDGEPHESA